MVTLDRNERARLTTKFRLLCRRSWQSKETGRHRGVITRTAESVFFALMYLTGKYGRVFPCANPPRATWRGLYSPVWRCWRNRNQFVAFVASHRGPQHKAEVSRPPQSTVRR
jgi:hypothetical protein